MPPIAVKAEERDKVVVFDEVGEGFDPNGLNRGHRGFGRYRSGGALSKAGRRCKRGWRGNLYRSERRRRRDGCYDAGFGGLELIAIGAVDRCHFQ